jgi:hypothetical protein
MLRLEDLAEKQAEFVRATDLWTAARPLFERSLQTPHGADIDARLARARLESLARLEEINVPTEAVKGNVEISSEMEGYTIGEKNVVLATV